MGHFALASTEAARALIMAACRGWLTDADEAAYREAIADLNGALQGSKVEAARAALRSLVGNIPGFQTGRQIRQRQETAQLRTVDGLVWAISGPLPTAQRPGDLPRVASRCLTRSSAHFLRMMSAASMFVTEFACCAKGCWSASASMARARRVCGGAHNSR